MTNRKQALKLAKQPYTRVGIRTDDTESGFLFVAYHPDLEGCLAQGMTMKSAFNHLNAFRVDYIEHLLDHNLPVPEAKSIPTDKSFVINLSDLW